MKNKKRSNFKIYFGSRINKSFENGLYLHFLNNIKIDLNKIVSKNLRIFETLKEYVNEFSLSSDVHLDNYQTIFICYFSILSFILIFFIFDHLYKFTNCFNCKLFHSITKIGSKKKYLKITNLKKDVKSEIIQRSENIVKEE